LAEFRNLLGRHPGMQGKGSAFPVDKARRAARRLERRAFPGRVVVLLGRRVCSAFGLATLAPLDCEVHQDALVVHLPHPSGVNHWWNERANRRAARAALQVLLGLAA
jgi:hypothetical protein